MCTRPPSCQYARNAANAAVRAARTGAGRTVRPSCCPMTGSGAGAGTGGPSNAGSRNMDGPRTSRTRSARPARDDCRPREQDRAFAGGPARHRYRRSRRFRPCLLRPWHGSTSRLGATAALRSRQESPSVPLALPGRVGPAPACITETRPCRRLRARCDTIGGRPARSSTSGGRLPSVTARAGSDGLPGGRARGRLADAVQGRPGSDYDTEADFPAADAGGPQRLRDGSASGANPCSSSGRSPCASPPSRPPLSAASLREGHTRRPGRSSAPPSAWPRRDRSRSPKRSLPLQSVFGRMPSVPARRRTADELGRIV